MIAIPAAIAAAGPSSTTGSPLIRNRPPSGWCTPASIFTIVDLPAPFSPSSACASPALSSIIPSMTALTAPNDLLTCSSASTGTAPSPDPAVAAPSLPPAAPAPIPPAVAPAPASLAVASALPAVTPDPASPAVASAPSAVTPAPASVTSAPAAPAPPPAPAPTAPPPPTAPASPPPPPCPSPPRARPAAVGRTKPPDPTRRARPTVLGRTGRPSVTGNFVTHGLHLLVEAARITDHPGPAHRPPVSPRFVMERFKTCPEV